MGWSLIESKTIMSDAKQKSYLYLVKPSLIKEWHPTKNGNLNPRNVITEHDTKVWWLCESGHEWEAKVIDRVKGEGCSVCTTKLAKENIQLYGGSSYFQKSIGNEGNISQKTYPNSQEVPLETYNGIEHRKTVRYKYKATAIIEVPFSENWIYAQMQNISNAGMYLETNTLLKQGEKIRIKFNKPLSFTTRRIFPSAIRWCKRLEDDEGYIYGYGWGVKYTSWFDDSVQL
jgi:hypothetical protein